MELSKLSMSIIWLLLITIAFFIGLSNGVAVMSIDMGSESMKVAIVSPGVPMEIVLNKESKRKTPVTIAFRNGERSFGEDAQVVGIRSPQNSFSYILDLLGKSIDNPMVELYKRRFPYYDIISDEERKTIAFRLDENTTYTPEELLAQILHKGKEFAENSAGQKISEAVITVPGFFNQIERRVLMQAADLAGIKVLQLINDYAAVALNYGIFRSKEINDTAHYVMFYDMGASSTTATIVSYQNVKTKEKGFVETNPHVTILGVGYDRTLGGLEVQIRLQHHLAKEFDALNKTTNSVFSNPRAMAKLFKEAGRVKNVLSANTDHFAQIEGLIEEHDFRLQVTREKLEQLCADLFERVANPIKIALKTSGLTMDVISQVVLVGAATRMPKIQEHLNQYLTVELSKNINTDEAAALGGVYKAADLSKGFKVKKFVIKDAVLFPIHIVFDRTVDNRVKQVKKSLFSKMNPYPQKKIITFNKYTENFQFHINYAELDYLPSNEIAVIGNFNLSTITLSGINEALEKHAKDGAESKGIKAHFAMDESGILNLVNVELVSEKSSSTSDEEEGTFSILGSTISKLFAGSEDKEGKTEESLKEDIKPVNEESEYPDLQKEPADKTKKKNESTITEDKTINKTEKVEKEKEKKATVVTIKEPIKADEIKLGSQILSGDKFVESQEKLHRLDVYDFEKVKRETALNNLETFIIDAQQKLESEEYAAAATSQEAENILKACSEISEWLYEDGFSVTAEVYEEKLSQLQKLTNDVYERVFEHRERPEVLKGMTSMLNASTTFLNNMRNLSLSSEIFTQVEIEMLEKVINETQEYYDTVVKSFAETALHESVKYKVRDIANKMALLDREMKYLINKAKIWRPKQDSVTNHTESTNENTTNTKEGSEESVPKSATDSQTENEDLSENVKVQNEKSVDSEESTDSSKDDESEMTHESTQKEIHQEL
ncbi:hypoxia up-regulated protein 1 isoform X1 [Frieseomelitta varia]|uniref:hypoxia up-regulated protein 1 isoform X1 n=1 Tax=Frieseomelitta varia TaxID=561572 RepID=UPI001CB68C48|nr:hypoxia up-regulated protein 1 isoform X1 [Frieseomelitta varia]XP_043518751.1 hypoxia up-regulated protein 1 isoform X1 [Frieseomelitta varia]XP_043518762.1 hypoxia up-regulated protein 1 isoform X1 [Frieseomelitta varia]